MDNIMYIFFNVDPLSKFKDFQVPFANYPIFQPWIFFRIKALNVSSTCALCIVEPVLRLSLYSQSGHKNIFQGLIQAKSTLIWVHNNDIIK